MIIKDIKNFNLEETFECGQCFRWKKLGREKYEGIAYGKKLTLQKSNNDLIIDGISENELPFWKEYFDLNEDYEKIISDLSKIDNRLKTACESADGIRILKQEPWEALCSFIISQNNNIPRIKLIVERLCENFGEKTDGGYTFPSAEKIAALTENDLAPIKSGFRAKYIIDASQKVSGGEVDLNSLYTADLDIARQELIKIKGVGAKVAECTLLYGFHRMDAFPIDVWIKRAMSTLFNGIEINTLGKYAGLAQQYIFDYSRKNLKKQ